MGTQFLLQMSLTRTQILTGNYLYPKELVKLKTTKHFIDRLEERGIGVNCIPTVVRVTKDNIYCGEADGNELTSVVIRLNYNSSRYVFLCFNPKDGGLKTLWFKEKGRLNDNRGRQTPNQDSGQAVRDLGGENEVC